ncbi:Shikimate kinase 2 [Rubripirellula obstinata]|uniref:Shikimate kinase n=1 Tax=Rubripirellula obstinata TaxID=406547 RepID=A0A5B1CFJ6_9BACT|nr:shikimate kinase [Rubripirellula obstinata]KAA1258972.1 Shikimate kinase 2 [Rubripirellula obstinata]
MSDPSITTTTQRPQHLDRGQIYLTGYRGSGKTSVAHALSILIDRPVVDLDAVIVSTAGKTVAEIFRDAGEKAFRDLETQCLIGASSQSPTIISLGGGAVLREQNRAVISQSGVCVWLDADPNEIVARLTADNVTESQRPGLTDLPMAEEVEKLMLERRPIYEAVSDVRVDTSGRTIDEVAGQIANWLTLPNKG